MKVCYLLLLLLFTTSILSKTNGIRKTYKPYKVNPHAPVIDGIPDDLIWQKAPAGVGFTQHEPDEGKEASEKTEFKICYDEKNLYVLISANDSEPDKITRRLSRRDDTEDSDITGVIIDSYNDKRTSFEFTVNPSNVRYDCVYSDDSFQHDESWDPVWESAAAITDSGWTAEMRIPFSQLRFASSQTDEWGLNVYRYIHRRQEMAFWQLIPRNASAFTSLFGTMEGMKGIQTPKRIEILPYSVSKYHSFQPESGDPFQDGRSLSATGGLDGKIGVTGNFTVDFTINPDFGQVEADPSEVNLSAFETFFQEKRPFFIEGKNIFQMPIGYGDGGFSRDKLFYSRRIGRSPHHYPDPDYDGDVYMDRPNQTSILGAAKLSGKSANGWSVGVLDAITAEESANIDTAGHRYKEIVEPFSNYFVGRLQKDINKGNSSIGGMITSTHRNINASHLNFINKTAYTGGLDFMHQWQDKTYFLKANFAASHIRGHEAAILDVQTSSVHYFQRPDAAHVSVDSSKRSLNGYGGSINFGRRGEGKWRYSLGTLWRSPGLEMNDIGFLRQADRIMQSMWVQYRESTPKAFFRNYRVNFNIWTGTNFSGERLFTGGNINGGTQLKNYWGIHTGINRETAGLSPSSLRGGPALKYDGAWNNWWYLHTDSRKRIQFSINGFHHFNDDDISRIHNFRLNMSWKPSAQISLNFNPFYRFSRDYTQYVTSEEIEGTDHYFMAKLKQKTFGVVFRLNYSITPELTIQYYGQPFISAGAYSGFKRVVDPRANSVSDRFLKYSNDQIRYDNADEEYLIDENMDGQTDYWLDNPDFNFKQFRSNLVVRWEYKPGSQIYFVWSQGRTGLDDFGNFSVNRDFRDLFSLTPDNIFLVKFNHWLSI